MHTYTVYIKGDKFTVDADDFYIRDGVLVFFTREPEEAVAMFTIVSSPIVIREPEKASTEN